MKGNKVFLAVALILLSVLIVMSVGCGSKETVPVDHAEETDAEMETPTGVFFGPGLHLVNIDIEPGRYRVADNVIYWARLSDTQGATTYGDSDLSLREKVEFMIVNDAPLGGPVIVDIDSSDVAFESVGDGLWVLIDDSYQPEIRTTFGDGVWLVGIDIEPGTYQTNDDLILFKRLSNFSHEADGWIDISFDNITVEGGATVVIEPSDVGFQSLGGTMSGPKEAIWTKID